MKGASVVLGFYVCLVFGVLAVAEALCVQRIGDFEVYTTDDGLGSDAVERIAVAADGRKWFACAGGELTSFDEVSWRRYPFYTVEGLAMDGSGVVWIAEWYDIYYLQGGAGDFHPFPIPDALRYGEVYSELAFDSEDRLWIGESGAGGLISYHPDDPPWAPRLNLPAGWRMHPIPREGDAPRVIWSIAFSRAGSIWCATNDALFRGLDQGHGCEWHDMHLPHWSNVFRAPRMVAVSRDGRVWACRWPSDRAQSPSLRVSFDDGETWSYVDIPPTPEGGYVYVDCISAVDLPGVDGLWVGARAPYMNVAGEHREGVGAYWLDLAADEWTWVPSWTDASFYDIQVDPQTGDVWFGTWGGGVGVLRGWHACPVTPIVLDLRTDGIRFQSGETMRVSLNLVAEGEARTCDFYVALEFPSGDLLFYPTLGIGMVPYLSGIEIPGDTHLENYELFSLTLPDLPEGTYHWFAACTYAGTMDLASNIASCEWQFEE